MKSKKLIKAEEIFNGISHGIGILISISALVLLVVFSAIRQETLKVISFTIFGASMIAMFVSSTLFHSVKNLRAKSKLNKLDHSTIYLLIAGTYTPVSLVALGGNIGWIVFSIIWFLALSGIIYKVFFYKGGKLERTISAFVYLGMASIVIFVIVPLIQNTNGKTLWFLLAGCLSYASGIVFYLIKKIPFGHGIWHLSILGGSICHFFAFLYLI